MIPIRVSRMEKTASRAASRMSQALARSTPAPMHQPCTAAMTGFRQRSMALIVSWIARILFRSPSR